MRVPFQVEIYKDKINGIMHIPEHKFMNTIVFMCYGFNGNRSEEHRLSVKLGDALNEIGVILVRSDYRGQGISSGEMYDVDFNSRVEDITAVINYLRGCFNHTKNKFYVVGFSDGARIVPGVCIKNPCVNGAILWNPIFSMHNSLYMVSGKGVDSGNKLITNINTHKKCYQLYGLPIKLEYLSAIKNDTSAYECYINLNCEKYCIWGMKDEYSRLERDLLVGKKGIHHFFVEEAGHLFNGQQNEVTVINATIKCIVGNVINEQLR